MEEATLKILRHTRGLTLETFKGDDLVYDAVVRNLEILGEPAKGIPAARSVTNCRVSTGVALRVFVMSSRTPTSRSTTPHFGTSSRTRFLRWRTSSSDSVSRQPAPTGAARHEPGTRMPEGTSDSRCILSWLPRPASLGAAAALQLPTAATR
jgi:hypothetical protein